MFTYKYHGVEFTTDNKNLVRYTKDAYGPYKVPEGVSVIADNAFLFCEELTSIVIPDTVSHIGHNAFIRCSGLSSVDLPDSVRYIGDGAFCDCQNLEAIHVSPKNRWFCSVNGILYNKKMTVLYAVPAKIQGELVIPEGVKSIKRDAFRGCQRLTAIHLPSTLTKIDAGATRGCTSLRTLTVAEGNPKYDSRSNCNAIIETATNKLIAGCKGTKIVEGISSITENAFHQENCPTDIYIPRSLSRVTSDMFVWCELESIVVAPDHPRYDSRGGCNAVIETRTKKLVVGGNRTVIPNGVTVIGTAAFLGRNGLLFIDIPSSVVRIESCAFNECMGLKMAVLPDSVRSVEYMAFATCRDLYLVKLSAKLRRIGGAAFAGCSYTHVALPDSLRVLDKDAFSCRNLKTIYVPDSLRKRLESELEPYEDKLVTIP